LAGNGMYGKEFGGDGCRQPNRAKQITQQIESL
jgi:hypothetical protein